MCACLCTCVPVCWEGTWCRHIWTCPGLWALGGTRVFEHHPWVSMGPGTLIYMCMRVYVGVHLFCPYGVSEVSSVGLYRTLAGSGGLGSLHAFLWKQNLLLTDNPVSFFFSLSEGTCAYATITGGGRLQRERRSSGAWLLVPP